MPNTALAQAALAGGGLYAVPVLLGAGLTLVACCVIIGACFSVARVPRSSPRRLPRLPTQRPRRDASRAHSLAAAGTCFSYEELRRHPNGLVWNRSLFDAAFAVALIVEMALRSAGYGGAVDCRGFSFLMQFTLVGSELCLFALCTDLFTALRNPFVNYKSSMRKYRLGIVAVSAGLAAALVGAGPRVYGVTDFGVCWVAPQDPDVGNGYMWGFFYVLLLGTYAWAFVVLVYARRRLSRGLRDTYTARMTSFTHGVAYVPSSST
jgi:hypothetical protein